MVMYCLVGNSGALLGVITECSGLNMFHVIRSCYLGIGMGRNQMWSDIEVQRKEEIWEFYQYLFSSLGMGSE